MQNELRYYNLIIKMVIIVVVVVVVAKHPLPMLQVQPGIQPPPFFVSLSFCLSVSGLSI